MAEHPNGVRDHIDGHDNGRQLKVLLPFDFSSVVSLTEQVNPSLSTGEQLVMTYFGSMHPKFTRAIDYYSIDIVDGIDLPDTENDDEEKSSLPDIQIPEGIMKTVIKYGNRLAGLSYGRRWIDHDFED